MGRRERLRRQERRGGEQGASHARPAQRRHEEGNAHLHIKELNGVAYAAVA